MSRIIRDDDGVAYERGRDGELVRVDVQEPLPQFHPHRLCSEHGEPFGYRAATCAACWSEINAGERPRAFLGRVWQADP